MIFRLYKIYSTGKTLYKRVLKPVYLELRKDAYELDDKPKGKVKYTRKKSKKNVVNQKPKRSHKRAANP
jgi:hypothetical protein